MKMPVGHLNQSILAQSPDNKFIVQLWWRFRQVNQKNI